MDLKYLLGEKGEAAFHDTIHCVHPLIHAARSKNSIHAELVLNSCVIACNVTKEIGNINYPPVAYGLCRCVLEIAAGTIHLAKNEDKVENFMLFGKWRQREIAKSFDPPPFPQPHNHASVGRSFREHLTNPNNPLPYPAWHGLAQNELLSDALEDAKSLKDNSSAFVHGDALISIAVMAYSSEQGWQLNLFQPMPLNSRVPVETAISICADLLFAVNDVLHLGCDDVMRRLGENMRALGFAEDM